MVPVETGRNKVVGMVPLDNRMRITVDGSLEYPSPLVGEGDRRQAVKGTFLDARTRLPLTLPRRCRDVGPSLSRMGRGYPKCDHAKGETGGLSGRATSAE